MESEGVGVRGEKKKMEFQGLLADCIASILCRTTPVDACRLSPVCKNFDRAAKSDFVWELFLPHDYHSIISQSPAPLNYHSKKELYLALAHRPLIIDNATKSFQLEKKSGKICYMLAARSLFIVWDDDDQYWTWIPHPDSRFPEVAELRDVCWLEIRGVMSTLALSPNTQYAAYLVYKMINSYGFHNRPVELSVNGITKIVCLEANSEGDRVAGLQHPNLRSDGWLEIEMGEFFNAGLEGEVQMSVIEINGGNWKSGIFLEGIEVRPKEEN